MESACGGRIRHLESKKIKVCCGGAANAVPKSTPTARDSHFVEKGHESVERRWLSQQLEIAACAALSICLRKTRKLFPRGNGSCFS